MNSPPEKCLTAAEDSVTVLKGEWNLDSITEDLISNGSELEFEDRAVFVCDVGCIVDRYVQWKAKLPRVQPFYAVKCNDNPVVLGTLAALGSSFDCASKAEIDMALATGISPEQIIYANTAKQASYIRHAAAVGVKMMTFDNDVELLKIRTLFPDARLVLRIKCSAFNSESTLFDSKYGCDPLCDAPKLLKRAMQLGVEVIGVSFHTGDGFEEPPIYKRSLKYVRFIFDEAAKLGFHMHLVDIGGGFSGMKDTTFDEVAYYINEGLEKYFPEDFVQVIAEPGRYFVQSAFNLATNIHSIRHIYSECDSEIKHTMYFINDGMYGSFGSELKHNRQFNVKPLKVCKDDSTSSSIWGQTCDGLDTVVYEIALPNDLTIGDWLVFDCMGSYSTTVCSRFNGFPAPAVRFFATTEVWNYLRDSKRHLPLPDRYFCTDIIKGNHILSETIDFS